MAILESVPSGGTRRRLRAKSPATLEPIGEFDCAAPEDVRAAVERARKAQAEWGRRTAAERAEPMWRLLDLFVSRQDEIVEAVVQETGKARAEAISMEVFASCDSITHYAKNAARFLRPEKRRIHGLLGFTKRLRIVYKPLGVIGLITPCADADLDRAAEGAVLGSCMNTGHYCCGTERVYVVQDVYDEFVSKVVERARALRGLYFPPTVVEDVTHEMDLMRKETFGPIVSLMRVADEEEAIRLANDSDYGLNGNVWTTDPEKGSRIAERMETGGVCVNDMALTYGIPEAPFGGVKASGLGQVNGAQGLRGFCHAQPITADRRGKGAIQGGYP
jgi:acyl-CoA reductase-like NAD-dependent aldehyde dehydrogenase